MGKTTGITWTDTHNPDGSVTPGATWNPWRGCHKVSVGCKNCFMYREQTRYGHDPSIVVRAAPKTFASPLKWKASRRVFTCSWSDFFVEEADAWRDEAWDIIRKTPHLTYQILTKRAERLAELNDKLPWSPHIWQGATVEHPDYSRRIDLLRETSAHIKFLSLEPLLAPMPRLKLRGINWVIVGGESGPGARPMPAHWATEIRDQGRQAGVAFYFKQWGGVFKKRHGRTLLAAVAR